MSGAPYGVRPERPRSYLDLKGSGSGGGSGGALLLQGSCLAWTCVVVVVDLFSHFLSLMKQFLLEPMICHCGAPVCYHVTSKIHVSIYQL